MLRGIFQSIQGSGLLLSARQGIANTLEPSVSSCMSVENCANLLTRRWATKKQGGRTKNKKDSHPKHLGVKIYGGQLIFPGQIIVRQRGQKFRPGHNVGMGKDHTIYATTVGYVHFREERYKKITTLGTHRYIDVKPLDDDYSAGYQAKVEAMVARRRELLAALRQGHSGLRGVGGLLAVPRGALRQPPAAPAAAAGAAAATAQQQLA